MSGSYDKVMEERKKLVEKIIENMKNGYVLPKPNWDKGAFPDTRIRNPVSGARYHGINMVRLYMESLEKGYTDGRWMTYKQAQSEGWQIRKGEQGVRCEKYIFTKQIEEENPETGEMEKKTIRLSKPMVNTFVVFNASQIEGIPEQEVAALEPLEPDQILEMAEAFQRSSECPIRETNEGRAYYSPTNDEIVLPNRDAFLDTQSFFATQLHEMVHSTAHPDRLHRPLSMVFGSEDYALEELRAELGSFFIQMDLNLQFDAQHFNSHTQYFESWIGALEKDPNELFRAITDAQKASDFLEERYELQRTPEQKAEPTVTILRSVHRRFHCDETMSFSKANALIGRLDAATVSAEEGYYKTEFRIDYVMNGKPDYYIGRQDLGDGDGTLIEHIEKYHAYYENNEEWENYILRNEGVEALEADKAQREMLLHEFVPYLKLHNNLSQMEQTATKALEEIGSMTSTETAYYTAMQEYVSKCRTMVNQGNYELPPVPKLKDFDTELEAYKEHVKEEIAREAAAAGLTIEEYAANGYESYKTILLSKQQEAAVRMAVKHELKKTGSGMEYLDHWIKKDTAKRQEIGIPMEEARTYSSMRNKYKQLLENPEQVLKVSVKCCSR